MSIKSIVRTGWILGSGLLFLMVVGVMRHPQSARTVATLPDGSRLRVTSFAHAASTNLTAPPHKLLGVWRTGLPYGFTVATTSGVPEFLVLFEREGWKRRRPLVAAGAAERMVMLDARDEVARVGQMLSGFGSSGPLWETANRVFTFGSLSNQGTIVRLALQVPESTRWKTIATLAVTNPVYRAGPATPAER